MQCFIIRHLLHKRIRIQSCIHLYVQVCVCIDITSRQAWRYEVFPFMHICHPYGSLLGAFLMDDWYPWVPLMTCISNMTYYAYTTQLRTNGNWLNSSDLTVNWFYILNHSSNHTHSVKLYIYRLNAGMWGKM